MTENRVKRQSFWLQYYYIAASITDNMKFNPIKRILYTEKGEVIRKLNCPYKISFSDAALEIPTPDHICDICNGEIVDTSTMAEEELLKLSQSAGNLCLKIDPAQTNVRIVYVK